jgi:hypothetical protein
VKNWKIKDLLKVKEKMKDQKMKCNERLNKILGADDDTTLSLFMRLQFYVHTFFCDHCRFVINQYDDSAELMRNNFFYDTPDMSDSIMHQILSEESIPDNNEIHEWVSFKKWIIAGCIILVSLVSAFFGFNFNEVASSTDSSYMLSIGLLIGLIVSIYGLLFIGTQMKQLRHFFDREMTNLKKLSFFS